MKRQLATVLLFGSVLTTGLARAAPETMTRQQIIDLAIPAVDYSYWWGHGCWRTDGTQHGSCSGSCPDCTHSGSYGADCSGFVGKVWQVPGPSPVTQDAHPYSTREFRYSETHWDQIPRDQARLADAFVYRNSSNTGGHIVLYESGDPWGSIWTYEARGCSYGIVHNLRTLTSSYVAITRHNLAESPQTGKIQGTVFEDTGSGTGDMSVRIPGATVEVAGGPSTTAREPDAYWSFDLAPGSYTITASAPGFQSASRTCAVDAGGEVWCSIGLVAVCQPDCSGRQCGPDPVCGTDCGGCPAGHVCDGDGRCQCQPDCGNRQCGPDPVCGTDCGSCPAGHACDELGSCLCQPDCSGRQCGPDPVCGEECGPCLPGQLCLEDGSCFTPEDCQPSCQGIACGPDANCGLNCGYCLPDSFCDGDGACRQLPADSGKLFGYVLEILRTSPQALPWATRPASGARVKVSGDDELVADENGYFELVLPAGDYLLSAEVPGTESLSRSCTVVAGAGSECPLGVYLTVASDPEHTVSGGCSSRPPGRLWAGLLVLLALAAWRHRR